MQGIKTIRKQHSWVILNAVDAIKIKISHF